MVLKRNLDQTETNMQYVMCIVARNYSYIIYLKYRKKTVHSSEHIGKVILKSKSITEVANLSLVTTKKTTRKP